VPRTFCEVAIGLYVEQTGMIIEEIDEGVLKYERQKEVEKVWIDQVGRKAGMRPG